MSDQLVAETSTWQHTTLTTDKYPCPRWDSNPRSQQASGPVCCECRVLSGRGLCDELITRPEESYRLCCVVVCDLEISRMGAPYIYDISRLRVKFLLSRFPRKVDKFIQHYTASYFRRLILVTLFAIRGMECKKWDGQYNGLSVVSPKLKLMLSIF